jgi:antibiotic biosynthesis monooxygenase (ABM) superfamily enzyme
MSKNVQHKRAFLIWLAIYPLITVLFFLFADLLIRFTLPVRTLILSAIAVPLMVYLILPLYYRLFDKWLNKNQNSWQTNKLKELRR